MYHFIGIKGSGMSGLAIIMKELGYNVQGSDNEKHYFTEENLIKKDIKILKFNKNNIKENMIIIKGNTFNEDNIEVKEAINKNLKIYTYQEMIDFITKEYNLIAVSGCHGKTTTSSMLAHVLDSNYLIGDGSGKINNSDYFVLEACEYKRHFLKYNPNTIIITNIDLDHVDYYKNIEEIIKAYQEFSNIAKTIIACGDNIYTKKIKHNNIYYYGINNDNYFQAKNIKYNELGIIFDLYINKEFKYKFNLPFYGEHMLLNTLAVISTCYLKNIKLKKIEKKLKTFKGAKRRFKETKILDNIVIDDYAHHPNEVKALIQAVKQKYKNKKIIGIFEPHTFSRTLEFHNQLAEELNKIDYSYIMDIYPSREKQEDFKKITSKIIIDNLKNGEYLKKEEIDKLLKYKNSVLVFMSPNDLTNFENKYIEKYKNQNEPPM
jgi:UDP-N-acetylmuramate--alanine ligase